MKNSLYANILQINNLSIGYNKALVSRINLNLESGDIVLLIGKNGTGKTTLLKTILNEIPSLEGEIKINNQNINSISLEKISQLVSVVLSRSNISPFLKVYDLVALGRYPYKKWYQKITPEEKKNIDNILELLKLTPYKDYYITQLSDGNLQKALIARAFVQDTPLLILDEPTSHLDITNKLEITKFIKFLAKDKGKIVLFTSHDLNLGLSIADQIAFIKGENFKTGFTEDLALNENIIDFFAGTDVLFNYETNDYEILTNKKKLKINIVGNSKPIYWLKKSLLRNGYSIDLNARTVIKEENSNFVIQIEEKNYCFSTLEKVIHFLSYIEI
ncbi:ABC transporter ATP-binding protein [Apibacter muscae]|uniref:ABC transporter ATP-binding protein n=1 Tax=Apibacter muscae TaxID=2509004 RepID=UPI0011AE0FC8|nr:ABC transporter ATP-binding protein [Apibacter muscae]TWP23000.1 ABC transporter ATP-binding protein [Apibacter muscae]